MKKTFFIFVFLIFQFQFQFHLSAYSGEIHFCKESLPVLNGGRVKPLIVLAHETLKLLTGSTTNALNKFCDLSLKGEGSSFELETTIQHPKIRKLLQIETPQIKYSNLMSDQLKVRQEIAGQKRSNGYKKDLIKLSNKMHLYNQLIDGKLWNVYGHNKEWIHISDFENHDHILNSQDAWIKDHGDRYELEITFIKIKPFFWAIFFSIISLILWAFFSKNLLAPTFLSLTLIAQIIGITFRILISERAPITNMYETVLVSGTGSLIIGTLIFFFKREHLFLVAALFYNTCCLLMLQFAGNMLDPTINPLVPVLRDNFWLSTHVTTIIFSYAALALSWASANIALIRKKWGKLTPKQWEKFGQQIYVALKFGIALLAAGIILGGVWADYSWGRFWGWDPKETWSLIVLLIYSAILHGRYTNWINLNNFIPLVALAFLGVIMAWFGVNYILASGLHSYGFSEGGAIFIVSFMLAQIIALLFQWPKKILSL